MGQCGREKIGPRQAPDDLALCPRRHSRSKQGSRRSVDCPCPTSGEFMDRTVGEPAARKPLIDLWHPKRKNSFRTDHKSSEMLDAISEFGDDRVRAGLRHVRLHENWFPLPAKAGVFPICSQSKCESMRICRGGRFGDRSSTPLPDRKIERIQISKCLLSTGLEKCHR